MPETQNKTKKCYIFDACALSALFKKEDGFTTVLDLLVSAENKKVRIIMNKINLLEVYYDFYRSIGSQKALKMLNLVSSAPIIINDVISDKLLLEAGRIKATYKLSLADSIVIAETKLNNACLLTSDHHEFDVIEQREKISFYCLR
jgi:predicted nucleic acid-binding protein